MAYRLNTMGSHLTLVHLLFLVSTKGGLEVIELGGHLLEERHDDLKLERFWNQRVVEKLT